MQLHITATELELTLPLKTYIERRFASVEKLMKHFEENRDVPLYLEIARTTQHHRKGETVYYAEATATVSGKTVRAEIYADDARKAIDELEDTLKDELRKLKETYTERRRG